MICFALSLIFLSSVSPAMQYTLLYAVHSSHFANLSLRPRKCRSGTRTVFESFLCYRQSSKPEPVCILIPRQDQQCCTSSGVVIYAMSLHPYNPQRQCCPSSADRAPGHGNHDVRSHGLNERNGTVDGLGPAANWLVNFLNTKKAVKHTQKRSSSARVVLYVPRDQGTAKGGGLRSVRQFGRTLGLKVSSLTIPILFSRYRLQAPTPSMTSFLASRPLRQWCSHSSRLPGCSV